MSKLLVVEGNEFSRKILVRRLQGLGFEMISTSDGREAVTAARQHRPDLILMDLDMPVMDRRAAVRALRSDPKTFRIPIIVLTAHAEPENVAEAQRAGCGAYQTKPIVVRRLVERIEEVLKAPEPKEVAGE